MTFHLPRSDRFLCGGRESNFSAVMNRIVLPAVFLGVMALSLIQAQAQTKLFVAPNGSDADPGTLAKPFATLEKARDTLRELRAANPKLEATISLRGGNYFLTQPFVLLPEDSGQGVTPIGIQAYGNEIPVISGGQPIKMTKDDRFWKAKVPDGWNFTRLYVKGQPRVRPRLPKQGYYFVRGELEPTAANKDKGFDRFTFAPGDFKANWANLGDVEMLGMQLWTMARLRVASVDDQANIVNFTGPTNNKAAYQKFPKGGRYLIENVKEALTEPGEFYLDRKTNELTYIPMPGEDIATAEVIVPRLNRLVELRGDVKNRQWVQNILFDRLTFAHTNWETPPAGYVFWQAEAKLDAAISMTGARLVSITDCAVRHTGEYAIALHSGCKNNKIVNCELTDLAAGGVKIGETQAYDDEEAVTSNNEVQNCLIAHGGRMHPAAVGVFIGHSPNNVITHNEIYDFYYTGISPGWSWGYGRSLSHHNTVSYNHIHQIGQGVLSDMGGIYTLGSGEGNHLHHNLIHDVDSFSYGGWGIYFDEGTSKILAENNVVYNTKCAGFHQHYGKDNVVRNNIFAFGREAQLERGRPEPEHFTLDVNHNIVLYNDAWLLGADWSGDNFKLDSNLYWHTDGLPVTFPGNQTLAQWQAKGQDQNSQVADPLFVDVSKNDYRLKPGSPALKMGIAPIDVSTAGRLGAKPYTGKMPRAFPAPPPPMPIEENFENVSLGSKVPGAQTMEDNDKATARVSSDTAASGTKSLKFTDAPGGKFEFNPLAYWEPHFKKGRIGVSFALRPEAGAVFDHEWRDSSQPYSIGPSLHIAADGAVSVAGVEIGQIKHSAWSKFTIVNALGSGEWTLNVLGAGQPAISGKFTCDKSMKSLDWLGFISNATDNAVFYLDNLKVVPGK